MVTDTEKNALMSPPIRPLVDQSKRLCKGVSGEAACVVSKSSAMEGVKKRVSIHVKPPASEGIGLEAIDIRMVSLPARMPDQGSEDSSSHEVMMLQVENESAEGQGKSSEAQAEFSKSTSERYNGDEVGRMKASIVDDEVARLKAKIEKMQQNSNLQQHSNLQGVVRRAPPFAEEQQKTGAVVKTKSVTNVHNGAKPPSSSTRNKTKSEKVRTRAYGPSEALETGSGSKKSRKKKV
ncbi:hypothetical protein KC19_VG207200 [Ceratodon purpureus]|uniref:Uncharacterized protein n=1 Tax=Ceratodon purpureus TaxID=3225 RepID=A0A8T0HTC9_CERPU|nr:hypothetical protein KC19_VG207200 [Ceratodon purpureus]